MEKLIKHFDDEIDAFNHAMKEAEKQVESIEFEGHSIYQGGNTIHAFGIAFEEDYVWDCLKSRANEELGDPYICSPEEKDEVMEIYLDYIGDPQSLINTLEDLAMDIGDALDEIIDNSSHDFKEFLKKVAGVKEVWQIRNALMDKGFTPDLLEHMKKAKLRIELIGC